MPIKLIARYCRKRNAKRMLYLAKIPPKKPENLAIRSNPVSASAHRWLGARASLLTGCLRDTLRPRACICILQFFICIVRFWTIPRNFKFPTKRPLGTLDDLRVPSQFKMLNFDCWCLWESKATHIVGLFDNLLKF